MTAVAIAEPGRAGELRFMGEIPSTPEALQRLVERLKSSPPAAELLLRSRTPSAAERARPGLQRGRTVADPEPARGPGEDQSPRCDHARETAPRRRVDARLGARWRPRGDARRGARAGHGAARARQGPPASAGFPPAPRPDLSQRARLDPGLSTLADHGPLRPPSPADRAAGLHPRRRGGGSAARAPGAADRGAPAQPVDGAGGRGRAGDARGRSGRRDHRGSATAPASPTPASS